VSYTLSRLHAALRAHAEGLYACQAAAELLIAHDTWLRRDDFTGRFTRISASITSGTEMAEVDWAAAVTALNAGQLPCSGSEEQMLRLTASLGDGIPVSLRRALPGLDERNISLVIKAVLRTSGQ
jgi:hypothetical protein